MFLISKEPKALDAFGFLLIEMDCKDSKIWDYDLKNGYKLYWASTKPSDNLSVFKDGFIIGKTDFEQAYSKTPYESKEDLLPDELNPLLNTFRLKTDTLNIEPNEQAIAYYARQTVSDFSLLVALHNGLRPSDYGIGMLVATGFFVGNDTLFNEIKRINYLNGLMISTSQEYQLFSFLPQKSNDDLLIQRYLDILPKGMNAAISMSGGMDSRFVLGLLVKKEIFPHVYSLDGDESDIVSEICDKLGLGHEIQRFESMDPYLYTIRTDARIYSGGGHYHKMFRDSKPDEYIFNGLSSLATLKNAYKAVWKDFSTNRSNVVERIIQVAYLGGVGAKIEGIELGKESLVKQYQSTLEPYTAMSESLKKHEVTRFFHHVNGGMNWAQAHTADLSFYRYPIFLLADKTAVELGVKSSLYANLYGDRLRRMNKRIMPEPAIDYSDNRSFHEKPPLVKDFNKFYHEYFKRFAVYFKDRSQNRTGGSVKTNSYTGIQVVDSFHAYFSKDLPAMLEDKNIRRNTKRAALTVNNALLLLEKYQKHTLTR